MSNITTAERTRFDSKWVAKGDCHLWASPLDRDGYGSFYFRRKNRRAHRVAYFMAKGDIPQGMFVDHICGNRHCVNPAHLRLVTPRENTLNNSRSVAAVNAQKQTCKNGHAFDRVYSGQRVCSTCEAEKSKRLRKKWAAEHNVAC